MSTLSVPQLVALRAGIAVPLAALCGLSLHFTNSYWAVVTVFVLVTQTLDESLVKGFQRIFATFLGCVGAVLFGMWFSNYPLLYYIAIFLVSTLTIYQANFSTTPYAWLLGGGTVVLVLIMASAPPYQIFEAGFWRFSEVALGALVSWVIMSTVYPLRKKIVLADPVLPDKERLLKHALKAGITCLLATLLWQLTDWYNAPIGIVSAIIVAAEKTDQGATLKAKLRFLGCLLGALVGFVYLTLFPMNLFSLLLVLGLGGAGFAYMNAVSPNISYAGFQGGIAFAITIMPQNDTIQTSLDPAFERLAGIMMGVIIGWLVSKILWPEAHSSQAMF